MKKGAVFIEGSILDRSKLTEIFGGCDCIVHIAAWHGIHETRGEKNSYDFFDLNVRGTFEVFEAAASLGVDKIIFISTTSVRRPDTLYGRSKILAELIAENYRKHGNLNMITLRPRGFIPFWNRDVYVSYSDWARWFWKGAVHIDDVAAAVISSMNLISRQHLAQQLILTLDSAYEYTDADLDNWDADGAGSTFKKYYPEYYYLALSYGPRAGCKANQAGYFRDGSLVGLHTIVQSGELVIGTGRLRRSRPTTADPGVRGPMLRRRNPFPLPAMAGSVARQRQADAAGRTARTPPSACLSRSARTVREHHRDGLTPSKVSLPVDLSNVIPFAGLVGLFRWFLSALSALSERRIG